MIEESDKVRLGFCDGGFVLGGFCAHEANLKGEDSS